MSPLTLAEHVCLTAVHQGTKHGWGIGTLLAPEGEIGRVWSLSRPLTYRAVDTLVARRLLARRGTDTGAARRRTLLQVTAAGRRTVDAWLEAPVAHVRDVRTELLLKLVFRVRAGLDPRPLLEAQRARFAGVIDQLSAPEPSDDLVDLWRRESARAVRRFLDEALDPHRVTAAMAPRTTMRLSARNQLAATVGEIINGEVISTVRVRLPDGQQLTAAITKEAVRDLDLATGDDVVVIVKSTEVMIGKLG